MMTRYRLRGGQLAPRSGFVVLGGLLLVALPGCEEDPKDSTGPVVESRLPAPGDEAEWEGRIAFTVSEPLARDSVTDANVKLLEDGAELRKKLVLSEDGRTVEVLLDQPLELPSQLTLTLTPGLTDLAGNPLTVPAEAWSWPARAWRLVKPTRPGHGGGGALSLTRDGDGRPLLSFVELPDVPTAENPTSSTVVTRWTGASWERFPVPGTDIVGSARLAVDGTGRIFLAAHAPVALDTDPRPFHVRRWDGQGWPTVAPPHSVPWRWNVTDRTRLAVTPEGGPLLLWEAASFADPLGTRPTLDVLENDAWKSLHFVGSPTGLAWSLALTQESGGNPWLAYVEYGPEPRKSYVVRWDGTAFVRVGGSLEEDAGSGTHALAADLKLDASGTPYIVWRSADRLYLQRWSGTRWETLASQEAPGTLDSGITRDVVSLVLTADGQAYVAWAQRPTSGQVTVRVDVWNGTTLEPVLTGLPAREQNSVTLGLDAHGRPMLAYITPPVSGGHQPGIAVRVNH